MISKKNFEKEYIQEQIKKFPKVDPTKMEMTIFAFGLLDEFIRCGVPLIFKGGTSLLLLLDNPQRVSTDIDIIVPKGCNFDKIFDKVKKRFPFYEGEERGENTNQQFRHFYFMFSGPVSEKECRINLDVAFEDNPYQCLVEKEVSLEFILTTGNKTFVRLPSINSIIGDKLTAFAPTTIGVNPFMTSLGKKIDNRLQVMKQFYDVARLYDSITDINEALSSYKKCQKFENEFRGTSYSVKETLLDTFKHAAIVASMGLWDKSSKFYKDVAKAGIQGLATNIFSGKYNQIDASNDGAKLMHLVSCLLSGASLDERKEYKGKELLSFKAVPNKKSFELIRTSLANLKDAKLLD